MSEVPLYISGDVSGGRTRHHTWGHTRPITVSPEGVWCAVETGASEYALERVRPSKSLLLYTTREL